MLFLAKQSNDLKTRIEHEGIEKIKSAEWTMKRVGFEVLHKLNVHLIYIHKL
jgi:hypothetical protein